MIQLFSQLAVATLLLVGWGFWVWLGTGRRCLSRAGWWIWCALAGVAIHGLVLQQLWYLGLRVSITGWLSGAVALGGLGGWIRVFVIGSDWQRRSVFQALQMLATVIVSICLLQGWSIARRGPDHYYGRAEYDQFNYVITAQFLMDQCPMITSEKFFSSPLFIKALETSDQRITQSVLHAELSVLSFSDAQESYGATTLCFLVLLGLAVMGYLVTLNAGWGIAAGGGVVAALLPAVTAVQLNGFFSQTSALWTLIAIPGILARKPWTWRQLIVAGSFLGFLVGAYTEFAPFGFGAAVLSIVLFVPRDRRVVAFGILLLTALALNVGYLTRAGDFFLSQLTQAGDAARLASWVPGSGTWMGVGRNFAPELANNVLTWIGGLVAFFLVAGFFFLRTPWRNRAIVLTATPLAAVVCLLLLPQLPVYAFGKLLSSASPVFFTVIILAAASVRPRVRLLFLGAVGCVAGLGVWDSWVAQQEIVRGTDKIDRVDVAWNARSSKVLGKHNGTSPVFIISADDALSAGWIYYHCRENVCYLRYQEFSDRIFPSEWHGFRQAPAGMSEVYLAELKNLSPALTYDPYPAIKVVGGTSHKNGVVEMWDSKGDMIFTVEFTRAISGRLRWFCFELNPSAVGKLDVIIDTPQGTGTIASGRLWAVAGRMENERYEVRLHSKTGEPFSLTFFGVEPIHQPPRLPYRFELVPLSPRKPSS